MVYVLLAEGFEEIEAVAPTDILRRAGIQTALVGVGGAAVTGAHGITFQCDMTLEQADASKAEMVYLPGGMPGTKHLGESEGVRRLLLDCAVQGKWVCALCAAPSVLGDLGLLQGKKAACYPGFEHRLTGAEVGGRIVRDGNILTGVGPGAALEFGFLLTEVLAGKETADRLYEEMQCR